jgi:hypothetical protein
MGEDVPVCEEHADVHAPHDKDDVEPGVLWKVIQMNSATSDPLTL